VYDPFVRGRYPVGVRTIEISDTRRSQIFPCEVWYPATAQYAGKDLAPETQDVFDFTSEIRRRQMAVRDAKSEPGIYPLIVFSHGSSRGGRMVATYLCTHLSSHGYIVAAMDHFDVVGPDMVSKPGDSDFQKAVRVQAAIVNRVPDIRVALDQLLSDALWTDDVRIDPAEVGLVGYSFGGWTVLSAPDVEPRVHAVALLATAGAPRPKPGIVPLKVRFKWGRDVPALYLAAENDVMTPVAGMTELFTRTPATKHMFILRRADHGHFLDNVEEEHQHMLATKWTGKLSWIPREMRPVAELVPGVLANLFVRGLTLCHFDAALRKREAARQFLGGDVPGELARRGIDAIRSEGPQSD
jgi:dienelactone hydrolase